MIHQNEDDLIILCGRWCWLPLCLINNAVSLADEDPACNWKMRRDQDELSSPHQRSDRVRSGFDSQKRWSGLTDTSTSWSLDWAWRVPALYGWRHRRRSRHWTWLSSALPNIHILAGNKVKIIIFLHLPSHATCSITTNESEEWILKVRRAARK